MKRVKKFARQFCLVCMLFLSMIGVFVLYKIKTIETRAEAKECAEDMACTQEIKLGSVQNEDIADVSDKQKEADKIDRYLESKGSPATGSGKAFVDSAEKWQIPADLMVAICGHESNFGKVGYAVGTNNMAGLGIHLGWRFDTYEQFIDKMAETLRLYYFNEGKDNAWKIENKWAPGYENSYGSEWAQGVEHFRLELENFI